MRWIRYTFEHQTHYGLLQGEHKSLATPLTAMRKRALFDRSKTSRLKFPWCLGPFIAQDSTTPST